MSADWTYQGEKIDAIPDQYEGFVYLIRSITKSTLEPKIQNNKATKEEKTKTRTQRKDWKTYWEVQTIPRRCLNSGEDIPSELHTREPEV